jgi:CBS domain-containing protein
MTSRVVAVRTDASVQEAAGLMVEHGISGLPVVDESGHIVGIVSEGDLILRQKPRDKAPWWRLFFEDGEELARQYQKAAGTTVGEIMTRDVISVSPEASIAQVAAILDDNHIRRVPVVDEGDLVGIVSRGDLIKALATAPASEPLSRSDAELVTDMQERLARESWASRRGIAVNADQGVLVLWGMVTSDAERAALETMARTVPGARGVDNHLVVRSAIPYHYGVA